MVPWYGLYACGHLMQIEADNPRHPQLHQKEEVWPSTGAISVSILLHNGEIVISPSSRVQIIAESMWDCSHNYSCTCDI